MVGDFNMKGRSDVAIGVEGQRDRAVAEKFLDDLGMHAPPEQKCGGCVPQIVNPKALEASLIERAVKPFDRPAAVNRSSRRRRED